MIQSVVRLALAQPARHEERRDVAEARLARNARHVRVEPHRRREREPVVERVLAIVDGAVTTAAGLRDAVDARDAVDDRGTRATGGLKDRDPERNELVTSLRGGLSQGFDCFGFSLLCDDAPLSVIGQENLRM